jgi:riboflavin kinase/FMN adenylyltransferase
MRVFRDFTDISEIKNPVLTIGTFDGVHLGHEQIIKRLNEEAERIGGESVLFTFYPHPRMVLYPESHGLKLIQTQAEKIEKLERMGLQNVIVHPFTLEFSRHTATEFVRDFLVNQLKVKVLVIGYDHQFGKNREGSIDFLRDVCDIYGFEVIEIPAREIDEVNISSTKVRNAIQSGDIDQANAFLGEPFELNGKVVSGDQIGRKIGYPTANLHVESEIKLMPGTGVYAAEVSVDEGGFLPAMMNIGVRPTISDSFENRLEVHIFDFNEDIYGKYITVRLLSRIRDEERFENEQDLIDQLRKDEAITRSFFNPTVK